VNRDDFQPNELTVCSPEALFINTGKLAHNPDLQDLGIDEQIDSKFNDFVVYDEAQVKMRYLLHYNYSVNN